MKKKIKILIPLFYDYYLYNYIYDLALKLTKNNFDVTFITFDEKVRQKNFKNKKVKILYGPTIIRFLLNRSNFFFLRFFLWLFCYIWSIKLKKIYNFVILPTDIKPIWYCLGSFIPSITIVNNTNMMSLDLLKSESKDKEFINKFFIDKFMGHKAKNIQGLGSSNIIAVPGYKFKENYEILLKEHEIKKKNIYVTGMPNYENVLNIKKEWNVKERKRFLRTLNLNKKKKIFTFFLSYSVYDKKKIDEIFLVIDQVKKNYSDFYFLLILHPKTRAIDIKEIKRKLKKNTQNFKIILGRGDEEFNTKIVLSSYLLLQKQSTIGFLAMLLKKPIVSYNLIKTNYEDDMYKIMGASLHCENIYTLKKSLNYLTKKKINLLEKKQDEASKKYCLSSDSPLQNIADIIKKININ